MADSSLLLAAGTATVGGAAGFGLGSALQQRATQRVRVTRPLDPRLFGYLVREPLWALGVFGVVTGLTLQLVALTFGPLALVQPVLATSILFAAVAAARLRHRQVDRVVLLGCLLCVVGLAVFLGLGRPRGGGVAAAGPPVPWALAASLLVVVAASLALAGRVTGPPRALALGLATGVLFGVNAGLMKVAVGEFRHGGAAELFGDWVLYAACVVGPAGFLLAQNAFQQGDAFTPTLAVIRSVDPIVAVVVGVLWLDESFAATAEVLAGGLVAAAVLVGGITLLAHRITQLQEAAGLRPENERRTRWA